MPSLSSLQQLSCSSQRGLGTTDSSALLGKWQYALVNYQITSKPTLARAQHC